MKDTIKIVLKGAAMGVAEVIPGVSGGTLAFITGIYERLLSAISSINVDLIKLWKTDGFKAVWARIDGYFLGRLLAGMAIGFILGLKLIVGLLQSHPVHIWSFFFGLILASIPLIGKQVKKWGGLEIVLLILGSALVYWITIAAPSQGSEHLAMVFLAGVLGVSALMLPGLSGSFVLLLLGMYTIMVPAIEEFTHHPFGPETTIIFVFALGMLVGLLSFAKVLTFTFRKYPNPTMALLTGFLIGSLNKVWPWQHVIETRVNSKGNEVVLFSESVLPSTFSELPVDNFLYGNDSHVFVSIVIMALAIGIVFSMDKFSVVEK
ncbi:MAG: putative membrane protein [Bacteroidia bacterium]|jgi:putative membrane protein